MCNMTKGGGGGEREREKEREREVLYLASSTVDATFSTGVRLAKDAFVDMSLNTSSSSWLVSIKIPTACLAGSFVGKLSSTNERLPVRELNS